MKFMRIVFTCIIVVFLLVQACDERKVVKDTGEKTKVLSSQKTWVNPDSLIVRIPGQGGMEKPEKISADLPPSSVLEITSECTPGLSFLPQTIDEKLAGDLPVKSHKPEIIKISQSKKEKTSSNNFKPPIITELLQPLDFNQDNVLTFKKFAEKRGLVTIQHKDSIFPPLSLEAKKPNKLKAKAMGQKDNALFDIHFLNADQELPNSYIRAIIKDADGVIWFGTHKGGLVSYDGQFFGNYTMKTGLSSDMIISLLKDQENNLWIGTEGGGVASFDGKNIIQYTVDQGLPSNKVTDMLEDRNGDFWFATINGVSSFDGKTISTYTIEQGLASNYISTLFEDDVGNIWFGSHDKGVTKWDGESFVTYAEKDGLPSNKILSIMQDLFGNIWIGTDGGGVSKFNGTTFTNYSTEQGLGDNIILSIIEDNDGNMWFGTHGNGITRFNGKSFSYYTTREGLSNDAARVLFDDDQGNLWVGTDGGGVSIFNLQSFTNYTEEQGLTNNLVLSIFQDKSNKLWFGTFKGGLLMLEESRGSKQNNALTSIGTDHGLPYNIISSIVEDNNNNLWLGTFGGGVSKLDIESIRSGKLKFTNYSVSQGLNSNIVSSVIKDSKGNIWFGTDEGATKFDGNKFTTITKKAGLGSNIVTCIFQDQNENLWFGTLGGGVSHYKDDTIFQYTTKQGLGNNTVWTITQDHNGMMWFGTDGGGLTFFNGFSFKTITTENGLSNDYVHSLVVDKDTSLWVGTTKGLNLINLKDSLFFENESFIKTVPVIINFYKHDGLRSPDFFTNAVFHDNRNRLWWGTENALSMFNLNNFKLQTKAPVVHLEELLINDERVRFSELSSTNKTIYSTGIHFTDGLPFSNIPIDLSLAHDLNNIAINFVAIDWSTPYQIHYQYKLQGFDKDWDLITNNNFAEYRNIPPGRYVFQLRAIGKTGKWSKTLEFPFKIRWPWWETWWAIVIYIVAFALLMYFLIISRVNIIKKQKIALENLIYDRTKELDTALQLAEQAAIAKSQFIATISHEIRTPLNAIMGLTQLAINTSLNPKQEDYLQKIDRSAVTLLSLINDILDFSKIEAGKMQIEKVNFDLEIVLNSVIILNQQSAREKKLEFVVIIDPNVPRMLIGDPLRIGQVITNLCSNAIKFTSSGEVVILVDIGKKISESELSLQISVKDTGIGISKEQIPSLYEEFKQADSSVTRKYGGTGLGLAISKLLAEMMGGSLWVETELGSGSAFFFGCNVGVQNQELSQKSKTPKEIKDIRMLVCLSHLATAESFLSIARTFSLNADLVNSCEEVMKQIVKNQYELLVIDQNLNNLGGVDIIRSIKENDDVPPIKTILIYDRDINQQDFVKSISGIDGYISKPFLPSVVLEKILSVSGLEKESSPYRTKKDTYLKQIEKSVSGLKVLLAEDNDINRQVFFELLNKIGIEVDEAENGAIALKKTLHEHYDLIFMDLHMPVMDGYVSSLKIRENNINTPIIAITADTKDTVAFKCKEIGINDIITKPINHNLLYKKTLKWLGVEVTDTNDNSKSYGILDIRLPDISIKELDIHSAIRRFGDNERIYLKMLKKFVISNTQTCVELRDLISEKKYKEAHLMIHSLKGESGTVGAIKVSKLSERVEKAVLDKNTTTIEKEILLLEESLKKIITVLQEYFKTMNMAIDQNKRSIIELVEELSEFLREKNPRTFDILDELNEYNIPKDQMADINKAVGKDNLKEALRLLKKLVEERKI